MKKIMNCRLFLLFLSFLHLFFIVFPLNAKEYKGSSSISAHICVWKDDKISALSLTFDDAEEAWTILEVDNEPKYGVRLLDERNLKGCFFVQTCDIKSIDPIIGVWPWIKAAKGGHEIQSHTVTHPYLTKVSDEKLDYELRRSQHEINIMYQKAGVDEKCISLAYPFCDYNDEVERETAKYYEFARGGENGTNLQSPPDFYALKSKLWVSTTPLWQMNMWVDYTIKTNTWLIETIHGITIGTKSFGWEPKTEAEYGAHFDYIVSKSADLWVGRFSDVGRYIKERNDGVLKLITSEETEITFELMDTLDDDIYNFPLTIWSEVFPEWNFVKVSQGEDETIVPIIREGDLNYIYFDAIPDNGTITLTPSNYR